MWYAAESEIFNPKSHKVAELHAVTSALKGVMTWSVCKGL